MRRFRLLLALGLLTAILGGGQAANAAGFLDMFRKKPPPAAPPPETTTTTTAPVAEVSTPGDSGLTRIRTTIESQAAWAYFTLDGAEIRASKLVSQSGATVTSLGPLIGVSGKGTAVIDFVFKIPSGTAPTVTTCRNYQGALTVTFTRMTDAPTVAARVVNNALFSGAQSGQCEFYQRNSVSRSALIGPVRWPLRQDPRRLVLANYFPWYDATTLTYPVGDQPTGPANTSDLQQVKQMVDMAVEAGLDGFIVEYEGSPAHEQRATYLIEEASRRTGFTTSLQLDLEIIKTRFGALSPEILDAILNVVATRSTAPSQLKMNGNPVVFVFGAHHTNYADWSAALDRLTGATGVRPYVIANNANLFAPGIFDFANLSPDRAALNQNAADWLYQRKLIPGLYDTASPLWVAPVSPGYDESRLGRTRSVVIDRADGQRFVDEWESILTSLPDWVVVTSWNEYYEQSHVMPGADTGTRALDQLKTWTEHFHQYG
jgi:hypothetical protein